MRKRTCRQGTNGPTHHHQIALFGLKVPENSFDIIVEADEGWWPNGVAVSSVLDKQNTYVQRGEKIIQIGKRHIRQS